MSKYDQAVVNPEARTVRFGDETYRLEPGERPEFLTVYFEGKRAGVVAYFGSGVWVSTGHSVPLDVLAHVAEAFRTHVKR